MHFKMSSAICFNLDQSEILLFGNELKLQAEVLSLLRHIVEIVEDITILF